jgi:hypothetical protein
MQVPHQDLKVVFLRKSGKELNKIKQKKGETISVVKNQYPQKKKFSMRIWTHLQLRRYLLY